MVFPIYNQGALVVRVACLPGDGVGMRLGSYLEGLWLSRTFPTLSLLI